MEVANEREGNAAKSVEPVYVENTLLRVLGVLFCHDPKRARTRSGKIELDKGASEKRIIVRVDPEYAQPGPFAHKVAMAVIRKQSRYGRPAQKQISFSQRELMRLAGRSTWGGHDSDELTLALKQIRYTHVIATFKIDDRHIEHDFSIFNDVLIERRASHTDPIAACTVVLADPIVQSLDDRHFTCLNQSMLDQLGTIGQAIYMRLFFHFAILFDGNHRNRVTFQKRYDAICVEWLGGLSVLKYKSDIQRDQLGHHLADLKRLGFLSSYAISKAKQGEGMVISFRPGSAFFTDYDRFYAKRFHGELQFEFHDDRTVIGDPHKVAYLFARKLSGLPEGSVPYVSSKDVETAKCFLTELPVAEIEAFIDYALIEASRTNFAVQTIGGIKQYLAGYLALKRRRAADKAQAEAHEAQAQREAERSAFDHNRRREAARLFDQLPFEERASIEALATAKAAGFDAGLQRAMFDFHKVSLTIERHGEQLKSFDEWNSERVA